MQASHKALRFRHASCQHESFKSPEFFSKHFTHPHSTAGLPFLTAALLAKPSYACFCWKLYRMLQNIGMLLVQKLHKAWKVQACTLLTWKLQKAWIFLQAFYSSTQHYWFTLSDHCAPYSTSSCHHFGSPQASVRSLCLTPMSHCIPPGKIWWALANNAWERVLELCCGFWIMNSSRLFIRSLISITGSHSTSVWMLKNADLLGFMGKPTYLCLNVEKHRSFGVDGGSHLTSV